jgi:hypothetical protein
MSPKGDKFSRDSNSSAEICPVGEDRGRRGRMDGSGQASEEPVRQSLARNLRNRERKTAS